MYQRFGYDHDPFAAHLAYYPWCGVRLYDSASSGVPVEIHTGTHDKITPLALCEDLAASSASIAIKTYEGQGHAFNHPYLDGLPSLPIGYGYPQDCVLEERGAFIKGDAQAAQQADQAGMEFLVRNLKK